VQTSFFDGLAVTFVQTSILFYDTAIPPGMQIMILLRTAMKNEFS